MSTEEMVVDGRFDWVDRYDSLCLLFVAGRTPVQVAGAFGAGPEEVRPIRPAEAVPADHRARPVVRFAVAGSWTVAVEMFSAEGARPEVTTRASSGTEAVSVARGSDAAVTFVHRRDGRMISGFEADSVQMRTGDEPDLLVPAMRRVGLLGEVAREGSRMAACLALVSAQWGVELDPGLLRGPMPGAVILPLLPKPSAPATDEARARSVGDARLAAMVAAADDEQLDEFVRRAVAAWCEVAGVELVPDGAVDDDTVAGRHLREMIAEGTSAGPAASLRRSAALAVNARQALPPRSAVYALLDIRRRTTAESLPLPLDVLPEPDDMAVSRQAALLAGARGQVRKVQATAVRRTGNAPRRAD